MNPSGCHDDLNTQIGPSFRGISRARDETLHAIGLMSGTSCDGMDAALVRIERSDKGTRVDLIDFSCFAYSPEMRARLLDRSMDAKEICLLNFDLGRLMAEAAQALIAAARNKGVHVDFIASHGHTVAHYPRADDRESYGTLQIGEPSFAAERTGLPVVSDFRPRDMAAGGQGAPLVPFADWTLFSRPGRTVACLNIGGIANVTVVPPELARVMAFDTGPGNMIIDGAAAILSDQAMQIDHDGEAAARGKIIEPLFDQLLRHPYFELPPPKSAGREQFGPERYLHDLARACSSHSMESGLATVTAVVARTIADAIQRFVACEHQLSRLIVSGGGAFNKTLMQLLAAAVPDVEVCRSEEAGIPSDAREAMAFALLGFETLHGRPANVPTATGAEHPVVLGKITPGRTRSA
ncbi:MAG: anhydro-N-acetylmuramic acid kinase [Planctomycetota bacterium]